MARAIAATGDDWPEWVLEALTCDADKDLARFADEIVSLEHETLDRDVLLETIEQLGATVRSLEAKAYDQECRLKAQDEAIERQADRLFRAVSGLIELEAAPMLRRTAKRIRTLCKEVWPDDGRRAAEREGDRRLVDAIFDDGQTSGPRGRAP